MPDAPAPLVVDRILNQRYRLVRPIARGGMAEVWEGRDEVLARAVAIKILHRHLAADRAFLERFRREAVAAARLAHPNVVATYDAATDGNEVFIVMELVRGRSLRQALSSDGPLSPELTITIGLQIAAALGHAHANGVIHRDVKPANILLCEDSDGWVKAKVADFGIAKAAVATGGDLTETGGILGTAKYLSPEQIEGHEPDARSDIYSLGVTLYESVCGQAPFVADTELATALAHVRSDAVPPRRVRAGIPRPLEAAILHAMARDPGSRPQTISGLRTELAAVDMGPDDAVALVSPDPTPTDSFDFPRVAVGAPRRRRRRWVVPAALLLVVLLVAAGVAGRRALQDQGSATGSPTGRVAPSTTAATVTSVTAFDPEGNGHEHDDETRFTIDGDPTTAWHSESYTGRRFGQLKDGVGLVLHLEAPGPLKQLTVTTPSTGWSAQVFVADQPGDTLASWGTMVSEQLSVDGNATFELSGHAGQNVLLWIIDQGDASQIQVNEVAVTAAT